MTAGDPTAIAVTGLTKAFGYLYALKSFSLTVPTGQFVTVFGPNGAGKTTLIRILSTLTKATSGTVSILGLEPSSDSESIRSKIGVIGHHTFLYEELTAEENLRFYGRLYGVDRLAQRVTGGLEEVGLEARRGDRVGTFSRGMQQRLAIARAMLHEPSILLLDEPYTGLDQHAAHILTQWLFKLRDQNRTTLMVTHDIERGIELADRVVVIKNGEMVYDKVKDHMTADDFKQTYFTLVEGNKKA